MKCTRMFASVAMSFVAAVVPMRSVSAATNVRSLCELEATTVQKVLGVSDANKYAGPELLAGGACSWKVRNKGIDTNGSAKHPSQAPGI